MAKAPTTTREQSIYEYITGYMVERGYAPTLREIKDMLDRKLGSSTSISAISYNLDSLEHKGYLKRDPRVARSIRVSG